MEQTGSIEFSEQINSMMVSVIIPVFNRFEYANRAIESVLSQFYSNWEIIVVDDCSKELYFLPENCNAYLDRIQLLRNETNLGPGLSRQRALDLAKGEYVCFLDSDDYYHPEFLEESIKVHQERPDISATYTTAIYIQTNTIREGSDRPHARIMPDLFDAKRPWPTCGLLWKRKFISAWKPLRTNQDSLFEIDNSTLNNSLAHIPRVLCYIDKGTTSNSSDLVKKEASDLHRNSVARYALEKIDNIKIIAQERTHLIDSICKRLLFTSSKIAEYGHWREILYNARLIRAYRKKWGILLGCLSLPLRLNIPVLNHFCKRIIQAKLKQLERAAN